MSRVASFCHKAKLAHIVRQAQSCSDSDLKYTLSKTLSGIQDHDCQIDPKVPRIRPSVYLYGPLAREYLSAMPCAKNWESDDPSCAVIQCASTCQSAFARPCIVHASRHIATVEGFESYARGTTLGLNSSVWHKGGHTQHKMLR